MGDDGERCGRERPANDNGGAAGPDPDPEALRRVDAVALKLARIIGRRMAREDFEKAMQAANDNSPQHPGARTDDADEE